VRARMDVSMPLWQIAVAAVAGLIGLVLLLDRDRVWVFAAPWNIHEACDTAYRRRKPGQQVVRFRWYTKPLAVVTDPRKASRVANNDSMYADFTQYMWDALWGPTKPLLFSGNAAHKVQRKHASFMLGPEFAEQARDTIRKATAAWLDETFADGEWHALNVHKMNELTWRMVASLTTGEDTPPHFRLVSLQEVHNARTAGLVATVLGTPTLPVYGTIARALAPDHARWVAFIRQRIHAQKAGNGAEGRAGAEAVLLRRLCEEEGVDEVQAFGVIVALHVAGHHAPAAATTFALYHILKEAPVLDRVKADLSNNEYLTQVLHETVRLYPGGCVSRFFVAKSDDPTIGLRRGETVIVPWYSFHRDPSINADPERFDPDRVETKGSFFPFGYGRHSCIGQRLVRPMFEEAIRGILGDLEVRLDKDVLDYHSQLVTAEPGAAMEHIMFARKKPAGN